MSLVEAFKTIFSIRRTPNFPSYWWLVLSLPELVYKSPLHSSGTPNPQKLITVPVSGLLFAQLHQFVHVSHCHLHIVTRLRHKEVQFFAELHQCVLHTLLSFLFLEDLDSAILQVREYEYPPI